MRHVTTLNGLLWPERQAQHAANHMLFWSPARCLTYREAGRGALQLARFLRQCGVRKGDHVLLNLPNSPGYIMSFFGVLLAGGVVMLGDTDIAQTLASRSSSCNIAWMIVEAPAPAGAGSSPAGEPRLRLQHWTNGASPTEVCLDDAFAEPVADHDAQHFPLPEPDDVMGVIYTSGSDGLPKGVVKTHRNFLVELADLSTIIVQSQGRFLSVLPWSYIYGLIHHLLLPLYLDATIYYLPQYSPRLLLETIEQHQIQVFVGVPSLYRILSSLPDPPPCRSLIRAVSSGAPLEAATVVKLTEHLDFRIIEFYGSTETGAIAYHPDKASHPQAVGQAMPHVELRVEPDPLWNAAGTGRLYVRGPTVSASSYSASELLALTDADGWYNTGDVGYQDTDGRLYLVGRSSRIIKVDGRRVALDEIEAIILTIPGVVDVVARSQPDPIHGESPTVEIATGDAGALRAEDIQAACRRLLPPHKRPRSIQLVKEIARRRVGKTPQSSPR
jgi:long-chain acyl-CoA synthetase